MARALRAIHRTAAARQHRQHRHRTSQLRPKSCHTLLRCGGETSGTPDDTREAQHRLNRAHLRITRRGEAGGSSGNGAVIQASTNGAHGVCGHAPYMMPRHVTSQESQEEERFRSLWSGEVAAAGVVERQAPSAAPTCARRQGFSAVATSTCLGSRLRSEMSSCVLCGLSPCAALRVKKGVNHSSRADTLSGDVVGGAHPWHASVGDNIPISCEDRGKNTPHGKNT